jgi:hypothetical protein
MSEALELHIKDGYAEVKTTENNIKKSKIIDLDDLHSIFKENVDTDTGDLGLYGDGSIGIRRIISRGSKSWVLINAINPCIDVKFVGGTPGRGDTPYKNKVTDREGVLFEKVFFPNLIMGLKLNKTGKKYKIQNSFMMSHEDYLMDGKQTMLQFPFANVYSGDQGAICWGSVQLPQLTNVSQCIGIMQMFLGDEMNRDLFRHPYTGSGDYTTNNLEVLLRKLSRNNKKLTSFPYGDIKLNKHGTYSRMISWCKSNL